MTEIELISLSELADIFNVNKSKFLYYTRLKLLIPVFIVGGMQVFDKRCALKQINKIQKLQDKGKTLPQIKKELL